LDSYKIGITQKRALKSATLEAFLEYSATLSSSPEDENRYAQNQRGNVLFVCQTKQTISMALTPQANYTDSATTTCRRNLVPTFVDRGVSRGQRGGSPTVVNLSFLDQSRYFSFK
jgi:hypothetical protein